MLAVDDRFQGRVLVNWSVSALLPIMILIRSTELWRVQAALLPIAFQLPYALLHGKWKQVHDRSHSLYTLSDLRHFERSTSSSCCALPPAIDMDANLEDKDITYMKRRREEATHGHEPSPGAGPPSPGDAHESHPEVQSFLPSFPCPSGPLQGISLESLRQETGAEYKSLLLAPEGVLDVLTTFSKSLLVGVIEKLVERKMSGLLPPAGAGPEISIQGLNLDNISSSTSLLLFQVEVKWLDKGLMIEGDPEALAMHLAHSPLGSNLQLDSLGGVFVKTFIRDKKIYENLLAAIISDIFSMNNQSMNDQTVTWLISNLQNQKSCLHLNNVKGLSLLDSQGAWRSLCHKSRVLYVAIDQSTDQHIDSCAEVSQSGDVSTTPTLTHKLSASSCKGR